MYLTGSYSMSVDPKGRVPLPADFRREVGETVVLAPLGDRVFGFTPEGFRAYVDGMFEHGDRHYDPRSLEDAQLKRDLTSAATTLSVDKAGRVALGKVEDEDEPGLLEDLGLVGTVKVVGVEDHFEIVNVEKWKAERRRMRESFNARLFNR